MNCTACQAEISSALYTYGDIDAPMCFACWLESLAETSPYAEPFFSYDDAGDGWLLKRLTVAGAVYLGGEPGQALMRVHRGDGIIENIPEAER